MKKTDKMSRAVSQLEHMYNALNVDFFGGRLPTPVITIQSKPGTYGHCTTAKIWKRPEDDAYELNIAAEMLSAPIEETIDTMLHEMVHLHCREAGIRETSRGGAYHNGKFKAEAERVGLECYMTEKHGWNTRPSDRLVEYALERGWSELRISRQNVGGVRTGGGPAAAQSGAPAAGGSRSHSRKYQCPRCGISVRATREVLVICGYCLLPMTPP